MNRVVATINDYPKLQAAEDPEAQPAFLTVIGKTLVPSMKLRRRRAVATSPSFSAGLSGSCSSANTGAVQLLLESVPISGRFHIARRISECRAGRMMTGRVQYCHAGREMTKKRINEYRERPAALEEPSCLELCVRCLDSMLKWTLCLNLEP